MGIAYRCNPETGVSVEVWHGTISFDVATLHIEQLAKDPEWAASRRIVAAIELAGREDPRQQRRDGDAAEKQEERCGQTHQVRERRFIAKTR